jgi:hypothetical protein
MAGKCRFREILLRFTVRLFAIKRSARRGSLRLWFLTILGAPAMAPVALWLRLFGKNKTMLFRSAFQEKSSQDWRFLKVRSVTALGDPASRPDFGKSKEMVYITSFE